MTKLTEERLNFITEAFANSNDKGTVNMLVENIRSLQQQVNTLIAENKRYLQALEEIKDEEWRLAGEFTTIYMAAYSAIYHDQESIKESLREEQPK